MSLAPLIVVWFALVPSLLGYVQVAVTLEGVVGLAGSIVVFFATLPQVYKKQAAPEDGPSRAKRDKTQRWRTSSCPRIGELKVEDGMMRYKINDS
ncbi:hypothetical protein EU546_07865 [Candidatus Thorarchaeota archaeon]|nr:MAG: hypothetical protein EU546_07865 [Candidatus Thorarchaeota archaeon]